MIALFLWTEVMQAAHVWQCSALSFKQVLWGPVIWSQCKTTAKQKKMATAAWGWWNTDLYVGAICVFGCILDDTQHIHLMFCADSMLLEPNLMLGKGHALKQWCISLISVYCSILDQGFEPPDLLGWKVIISLSHWLFSVVSGLEHFVLHLYKCQMT